MISLTVDTDRISDIIDRLPATEKQVIKARKKALSVTEKEFTTRLVRHVSKEAKIPQSGLAGRLFTNNEEDGELRIWIGANAIAPGKIGTPQVYGVPGFSGGVSAGRRKWPGAFLADVYGSGREKAFIRMSSKFYSRELYPTKYRPGDRGMANAGRFPVVRAAIPVDDHIDSFLTKNKGGLSATFIKEFRTALEKEVIKS